MRKMYYWFRPNGRGMFQSSPITTSWAIERGSWFPTLITYKPNTHGRTTNEICMPHAIWSVAHITLWETKPTLQTQKMQTNGLFAGFVKVNTTATLFAPCNAEEASPALTPPRFHHPAVLPCTVKNQIHTLAFGAHIDIKRTAIITTKWDSAPVAVKRWLCNLLWIVFAQERVEDIKVLFCYLAETTESEML